MMVTLRQAICILSRLLPRGILSDRRGATGIFLGFALLPMLAAIGLAVDSTMGYMLKSRMSKALDTAGLAAGRVAFNGDPEAVAQEFFDANFGATAYKATLDSFSIVMDDAKEYLTLTAQATMPTSFMKLFGKETMTVSARTVIQRQTTGMELALVMDNTGSMWGTPFNTMQEAAHELVDIIYGDYEVIDNLWVSLVPYTATINIGPARTGWLAAGDRVLTSPGDYSPSTWKGCVEARDYPYDSDDTVPADQPFTSYYYAATGNTSDNNWPPLKELVTDRNNGRGPNLGCGPPITPLTAEKTKVHAAVANMAAWHRGGTTGNLGLSWGWRTLSPQWRGLWGGDTPSELPLDYNTPLMEKVVVILTDGNNQFYDHATNDSHKSDYTAYDRLEIFGYSNLQAGRQELDKRMAETCVAMKAEGITIYSIIFGNSPDSAARTLFQNCATKPEFYFYAPSNDDLRNAFRTIGGQLSNLRIAE